MGERIETTLEKLNAVTGWGLDGFDSIVYVHRYADRWVAQGTDRGVLCELGQVSTSEVKALRGEG